MGKYTNVGKEVLFLGTVDGKTVQASIAQAADTERAHLIANTLNRRSSSFIGDALRTLSPNWYGQKVSKANFINAVNAGIRAANELDKIKKTLFYGRDNNLDPAEGQKDINALPFMFGNTSPSFAIDIIHGILGKFTEAGELLEALKEAYNGEQAFDITNLEEEIGDGFWYDAIILNQTGGTFEGVQDRIISKLKARFPDKFANENANTRNLDVERAILEGGVSEELKANAPYHAAYLEANPVALTRAQALDYFTALDEYADGDIEPAKEPLNIVEAKAASGKAAVEEAAKSAAQAFANVGKVQPDAKPVEAPNPELAKPISERQAPMPQEGMAQQNNPKD